MYKALQLSPMIPSFDIEETVTFFKDVLNFKIARDDGSYAILHKDDLTIHILQAGTDIGEMECYLEVDDVDGLWRSIKDKVTALKVREPFDRAYGMREMHITIPQTNALLFVGQRI